MQVKFFTIPILGGESQTEALNLFLRSKKVLNADKELINNASGAFWCFCISYLDDRDAAERERPKVDYRNVLEEKTFARFLRLRELRKRLAQEEGVPAFAIFTDEELAGLARLESPDLAAMKTVRGIGDKKVEKYGAAFLQLLTHEKGGQPD